jgi:hypothetical protein
MPHKTIDSSLGSILNVTLPMVLAVMSTNLMCLIDRFMLAGYSLDSMTAVAIAVNSVMMFTCLLTGIASSTEVLVGQYNGSKQYEKLAAPTWQMYLYVSVCMAPVRSNCVFCRLFEPISYILCKGWRYFSENTNGLWGFSANKAGACLIFHWAR